MNACYLELKSRIEALLQKQDRVLVAIDGPCTAGKTTLGQRLSADLDGSLFHMDDFFLRPEQRIPTRLAEAGGNVDYERFYDQVICPMRQGKPVFYQPYDCKTGTLNVGKTVEPNRLCIIEGSYSMHPYFSEPYDLKVFLFIDPALQHSRLALRPAHLQQRFLKEWIPMEQEYFRAFSICERSDLFLHAQNLLEVTPWKSLM